MIWNLLWHGGVSHCWVRSLMIDRELFPIYTCILIQTHVPFVSCFEIPLWLHSLLVHERNSSSVLWLVHHLWIHHRTRPLVIQLLWISWRFQSWNLCYLLCKLGQFCQSNPQKLVCLCHQKLWFEVKIVSFALSLLALFSSWITSCWLLWLAAIISRNLGWIFASSINVALRSWPGMDPRGDWYWFT